ncbi:hypothetical protein BPSOL_1384 [Bifidobacterium pseudolongum]|nr:hypothetical protein BPSOL_1384 [Bifidobacterium pseudolongum]
MDNWYFDLFFLVRAYKQAPTRISQSTFKIRTVDNSPGALHD